MLEKPGEDQYLNGLLERDRDIRLAPSQASAISEHANETGHYPLWNKVTFIDRDPHWYTLRVKEAIHIRLHPDIYIYISLFSSHLHNTLRK